MKILITGFQPFGNESINPSLEVLKQLPNRIDDNEIIKLEIPVERYTCLESIEKAMQEYDVDVVLSIGQAGGRSDITIERVGINVDDYGIADNVGNMPIDESIVKDGPAAYFSNLPIKAMMENIRKKGIPASISNTAGTYVCNHVLYGVANLSQKWGKDIRSGFIHIPFLPEQVLDKRGVASMDLTTTTTAITIAIETIISTHKDIKAVGGKCD